MADKVITTNDEIKRFIQLHHKVDKKNLKVADLEGFRRGLMKYPALLVTFGDMAVQAEFRLIEAINVPKSSQEAMQLQLQNIMLFLCKRRGTLTIEYWRVSIFARMACVVIQ